MAEKRKSYTREFKIEAVRLLETSGKNGHEIEKDLGLGSAAARSTAGEGSSPRKTEAYAGVSRKRQPARDEELARLERENEILREERDILRKAVVVFSRGRK